MRGIEDSAEGVGGNDTISSRLVNGVSFFTSGAPIHRELRENTVACTQKTASGSRCVQIVAPLAKSALVIFVKLTMRNVEIHWWSAWALFVVAIVIGETSLRRRIYGASRQISKVRLTTNVVSGPIQGIWMRFIAGLGNRVAPVCKEHVPTLAFETVVTVWLPHLTLVLFKVDY